MRKAILLACAFVFAAPVFAQIAEPASTPTPVDEFVSVNSVCYIADDLARWLKGISVVIEKDVSKGLPGQVARVQGQLSLLCSSQPGDDEFKAGRAGEWLLKADGAGESLSVFVQDALRFPLTLRGRDNLREVAEAAERLQIALSPLRKMAYSAVRTETKEVVKTVEVPCSVAAPIVEQPPVESQCVRALRESAGRWATQLDGWTTSRDGFSGYDYALAQSSKSELFALAHGNGDPVSYIVGWLTQWPEARRREIRQRGSVWLVDSGPMPQIAADMQAQLRMCGVGY